MTAERVVVRLAADDSNGEGGRWIKARALEWAQKTGNTLEYIDRPNDSTATIYEFWNHWRPKAPTSTRCQDRPLRTQHKASQAPRLGQRNRAVEAGERRFRHLIWVVT
jgi:hypothetical protein